MIKELRQQHRFTYGPEIIYNICLGQLGAGPEQRNRFKISQITGEAVDEFIRKMRITGVVSLRGNGRFLDFNSFATETITYILENYTNYTKFQTKEDFFNYMGQIDPNILTQATDYAQDVENVKQATLLSWAQNNTFDKIANELKITCSRSDSHDDTLKYIDKPTRLEFLTSVILKQKFPDIEIKPNYTVDDEGLPVFTAAGGLADIECFDVDNNPLVEVTLMSSRNQACNEVPAITRHLKTAIEKYPNKRVFSVMVAPHIHEDTKYMAQFSKHQYDIDILTYDIDNFITAISNINRFVGLV